MNSAHTPFFQRAFQQVDGASLGIFRILFALMAFYNTGKYLDKELLDYRYGLPEFHIPMPFFDWVPVPSVETIYIMYLALLVCSGFLLIGLCHRIAAALYVLIYSWIFVLDASYYMNHYYLMIIIAFMMIFLPMSNCYSIKQALSKRTNRFSFLSDSSNTAPLWAIWALRIKVEIVLIYAGLVKLNEDWLLRAEPLSMWLKESYINEGHIFGNLVLENWFIYIGAYSVILLHCLGAPLLMYKKTRLWVFFIYCLFHIMNSYTFHIGVFPWLTIAMTTIFFAPNWPRNIFMRIKTALGIQEHAQTLSTTTTATNKNSSSSTQISFIQKAVVIFVFTYLGAQILIPLRPLLYPGPVIWNEKGHEYSWRMKLRDTDCIGHIQIQSSLGRTWNLHRFDLLEWINPRQMDNYTCHPRNLIYLSQFLEKKWAENGYPNVAIFSYIKKSVNGRHPQYIISPTKNLTKLTYNHWQLDWLEPFDTDYKSWHLKYSKQKHLM